MTTLRTRVILLLTTVLFAALAGCAPGPEMCLAWRQTSLCAGRGPREPMNDQSCETPIVSGWSGYCECAGGRAYADCGHQTFTCDAICRAAFGGGGGGGDTCSSATTCDQCTPRAGCGFCAATGRCMSGGSSGPSGGVCGGGWRWLPTECEP